MRSHTSQNLSIRILFSDSLDIRQAIATACDNGENYEALPVIDGVQLMHLLLDSRFDLAIVDLEMETLDALRLIPLIRATPELRQLQILAVACAQDPASPLEGIKAGATDYLPRPFEWPQIAMRIRQMTGTNQLVN
jgi:two-component system response regulator PhoP